MNKVFENKEVKSNQAVFREPRIRKLIKIELFADDSRSYDSIVRNVSTFGLRATSPIGLQPGQSIEIKKAGYGKVSGTVRWVNGREFGMQFDQPIDIELFNFGSENDQGHFVKKIDNGHVWSGFQAAASIKRPGFRRK